MTRHSLEVADIVRAHAADLEKVRNGRLSGAERKVLRDLAACRTAACGGHVQRCDTCHHIKIAYNSCRNRHCPKCQELARTEWVADRQRELLPVDYFHVVFTLPHELAPLALQNKAVLYDLLFRTAAETLQHVARRPKHLGAEIGFLAVLHTWGQTLDLHPHVHCVVPGGGLSPDQSRWVPGRAGFFLPVRVLSRLFRGKFLSALKDLHERSRLTSLGQLAHLQDAASFRTYLAPLYRKEWVVYCKPPFSGPLAVYKYLARYTHRVAISNSRLLALKDGKVSFTWKDYANGSQQRVMTLGAVEFLRRFLLHILPKGFVRIRHYGFLANRCREQKVTLCRRLLQARAVSAEESKPREQATRCPRCQRGTLVCILLFGPGQPIPDLSSIAAHDTS